MSATVSLLIYVQYTMYGLAGGIPLGYGLARLRDRIPDNRVDRVRSVVWAVFFGLCIIGVTQLAVTSVQSRESAARSEAAAAEYKRITDCQARYNEATNLRVARLAEASQRSTEAGLKAARAAQAYWPALREYIGIINTRGQLPGVTEAATQNYLSTINTQNAAAIELEQATAALVKTRDENPPPVPAPC